MTYVHHGVEEINSGLRSWVFIIWYSHVILVIIFGVSRVKFPLYAASTKSKHKDNCKNPLVEITSRPVFLGQPTISATRMPIQVQLGTGQPPESLPQGSGFLL